MHKQGGMNHPKTLAKRTRDPVVTTPCSSAAVVENAHAARSVVEMATAAYVVVAPATTCTATLSSSSPRVSEWRQDGEVHKRVETRQARAVVDTQTTTAENLVQPAVVDPMVVLQPLIEERQQQRAWGSRWQMTDGCRERNAAGSRRENSSREHGASAGR